MTQADDTQQLLGQWCGGSRAALELLVSRHAEWIQNRIRVRRGELLAHHETMDQFQDLVLQILTYSPRFVVRNAGQFRGLIGRMIENDLVDRARAQQRRRDLRAESLAESVLSLAGDGTPPQGPASAAQQNEELAWIRLGLEFLPDDHRRLVERHALGGRAFAELEKEFGATSNALRERYRRSVVKLSGIIARLKRGEIEQLVDDA